MAESDVTNPSYYLRIGSWD